MEGEESIIAFFILLANYLESLVVGTDLGFFSFCSIVSLFKVIIEVVRPIKELIRLTIEVINTIISIIYSPPSIEGGKGIIPLLI